MKGHYIFDNLTARPQYNSPHQPDGSRVLSYCHYLTHTNFELNKAKTKRLKYFILIPNSGRGVVPTGQTIGNRHEAVSITVGNTSKLNKKCITCFTIPILYAGAGAGALIFVS